MAHAILGHVQFQLPRPVGIGHAEQHLAALHRPVDQAVPQVPRDHQPVDRALDFQFQLFGLVQLPLGVKALLLLLQFRLFAGQPVPLFDAQLLLLDQRPLHGDTYRSLLAIRWPWMSVMATSRSVLRS